MRRFTSGLLAATLFGLLSGCGPTVELSDVAFSVAFTSPSAGGEEISTEVLPRVGFSRAVDTAEALSLLHLETDDGTDLPVTMLFVDDAKVVVLAPRVFLDNDTDYTIVVPAETVSADGVPIGTELRAAFRTVP